MRLATILLGTLLPLAQAAAQSPQPAALTGWWLDESKRAGIDIEPCGDALCGRILWLRTPLDAAGKPKTDIHNGDAAQRTRPLCGLPILTGFQADGPGAATGGRIYNPEDGATYRSTMHLNPDGTLRVRGYVGIPLLGKTQLWTRPPTPPASCQ